MGNSALHIAASSGHATTLPNALGYNALHLAARQGHREAARELLMHSRFPRKAVNATTKEDGTTALHLSVRFGHLALVLLLLQSERFDAICHLTAGDRRTALHLGAKSKSREIIAALLKSKRFTAEAVNVGDASGRTALHIMVEAGDLIAVWLLRESGKFRMLEARSKPHGTALDLARKTGNMTMIHLLQPWFHEPSVGSSSAQI